MATKNELKVFVNSGEEFRVEVNLKYTPEQLKNEKVSDFLKEVKAKYCETLETDKYKQECSEQGLDIEKLKEFALTSLHVAWNGKGDELAEQNYKATDLERNSHLYDLADRSKIGEDLDDKLRNLEFNKLEQGYYPLIEMFIKSK